MDAEIKKEIELEIGHVPFLSTSSVTPNCSSLSRASSRKGLKRSFGQPSSFRSPKWRGIRSDCPRVMAVRWSHRHRGLFQAFGERTAPPGGSGEISSRSRQLRGSPLYPLFYHTRAGFLGAFGTNWETPISVFSPRKSEVRSFGTNWEYQPKSHCELDALPTELYPRKPPRTIARRSFSSKRKAPEQPCSMDGA